MVRKLEMFTLAQMVHVPPPVCSGNKVTHTCSFHSPSTPSSLPPLSLLLHASFLSPPPPTLSSSRPLLPSPLFPLLLSTPPPPNLLPFFLTANRTEPNLKDLAQAFADLGIDVAELSEFCREVESTKPTQAIPKYPLPRKSTHVNLSTTSRVVARKQISRSSRSSSTSSDEEEIIPCYLPPLPSKHSEKGESGAASFDF